MEEKDMIQEEEKTLAESQEHSEEHHHHHHHHHSHHRRKHKSSRSKKFSFRKLKKSFKKHKKIWIPILIILVTAVVLFAILGVVELMSADAPVPQQTQGIEGAVVITAPVYENEQRLVNAAADKILTYEQYTQPAHVVLKEYEGSGSRLDVGLPVKLRFSLNNKPTNYTVEKIVVETAENNNFLDSWKFTLDAGATSLDIFNLKTNTQYYYRINYHFTNGIVSSACGSFRTANTPRILSIGGVHNARDIGGWVTTDGKTIRQGLLYRGTELDGAVQAEYKLSDAGKKIMLEQLGIRMDMDLRWSEHNPSGMHALGEDVRHIYFGVEAYTNIFLESYRDSVRNVFSELANEENYPIYIHCTYGRDRTGTICALLEALLGVSEEQIWKDYQLSALENIYQDNISFGNFMESLQAQPGNTLQEKAEGYLLSIGVTGEEIEAIRAIFLA